nr:PREDICTED: gamma-tubulin complex component 6 [Lepisosteus oculatus]
MEAPPGTGTGLLALGRAGEGRERYEKETRLSLFGALQHTRTSDMEIRLDLPPVPSNAELTGLAIRVPPSLDQSEDEGFQSASNLTPDSQSEPSPSPEPDVWEALRSFEPGRRRCWEGIGCPPGRKELPYLSEAGREAFDQLYQLREGGLQLLSTAAALPPSPLPLHTQTQLVTDVLNVLIGVASTTFPLDQVTVQFSPCPGICVSGVSPDSMQGLLGELAEYGTHYLRLSRFCLQGAHKRGLVFQAFTGALRRYLQYYRACVLCTPPTLSLLAIGFLFRKVGRQLRYLSELCCVDGGAGGSQAVGRSSLASFPVGVKLLSYLYNEAQSNCSNENYAVLLSLLKSSCEPYTRFIYDWVYSGVFRDVYGEFMIQVNEDFLSCRDKQFWTQGYTLISQDVEECVPVFLRHMANDIYVCGKTINLLKICCPQVSTRPLAGLVPEHSTAPGTDPERRPIPLASCSLTRIPIPRNTARGSPELVVAVSSAVQSPLCTLTCCSRPAICGVKALSPVPSVLSSSSVQCVEFRIQNSVQPCTLPLYLAGTYLCSCVFVVLYLCSSAPETSVLPASRNPSPPFLRAGRQVSRRLAEEARKRERFEEMKQQLEQDREWRSEARRREQEDDFGFARELRDRERRLQALEEQLERQARKELVEQYSRLSEEAARRERRALWRAHRLRLDSARAQFLEEDHRHTQALLQQFPLGQGRPLLDILPKTQLLTHRAAQSEQQPSQTEAPLLPGQGDQDQREQGLPGSESQDTDTSPETPGAPAPSSSPAAPLPSLGGEPLISEELDLDDFLPRARPAQDRGHSRNHALDAALLRIESDLLAGAAVGPAPVQDYDFSSPFSFLQAEETPPRGSPNLGQGETNREQALCPHRPHIYGHPSTAHIRVGENVSEVEEVLPRPSSHGQPSDSSIPLGQYASEVGLSRPQRSSHGHPSQASVQLGEQTQGPGAAPDQGARRARLSQGLPASEGTVGPDVHTGAASPESAQPVHGREGTLEEGASRPSESTTPLANREGSSHGREAHQGRKPVDPQLCALGLSKEELVDPEPGDHESVTGAVLTPEGRQSIPHAARAERKLDGKAPEAESIDPRHSSREDASDANSKVGRIPAVDIRDHPSSAHFKVGAFVLEQEPQPPAPSVYGHVSDASINVGQHVSEVVAPVPAANRHGHSSDASIKVGGFVSEVAQPRPRWNRHGHTTDARIKVGGYVSEQEPPRPHGHASDTSLQVGCVVSGTAPSLPTPQPHGHASDTSLQVGCVVSGTEPSLPTPQPHGHASDSSIKVGQNVAEAPPAPRPRWNVHGHASQSHFRLGVLVSTLQPPQPPPGTPTAGNGQRGVVQGPVGKEEAGAHSNTGQDEAPVQCAEGSPGWSSEQEYLLSLAAQYEVEQYQDNYSLLMAAPDMQLLQQVTRGAHMVNKAVVDYFFVELEVERHFEALRHFLLMEDGEFAQSLSDLLFEKLGSGQTPGELLTPFVLNSILTRALQYSLHGDSPLAANFTFALRFLPETFHPHAPDALGCLELRYKVDWPLNIVITDSCMSKYNRLFSFLLQLKHMVWTLRDVWFHLKRAALVKGAGRGGQFRQLQLYRHEMQHFVKVIQGYIANQILQVSWSEFSQRLGSVSDLDAIHRRHADYLNRAIFRGLLTEKAAPVMNIIHSIFSLILKFRTQLIAQPWGCQQGEAEHPNFVAMQHSYRTFKYYSHFLFKVVTKLVNRGYQPHLEDFLLRINFNNYYKDS